MCSCGSVVEHCVSSAKGCGFNSQETECKNVNVVVMEAELIQRVSTKTGVYLISRVKQR